MKKTTPKIFFILLLLLVSVIPANALENESFEFSVRSGTNTLDLEKTFDGTYVSAINGTFYESSVVTQDITFTAADTRDNVLVNITIPKHEKMNDNFSDLRFYSNNMDLLPYYIIDSSSTHANISLRVNVTGGSNSVIMSFGNPGANPASNLSSIYLYYYNNSSGQRLDGLIYSGSYTNNDALLAPSTAPGQNVYYFYHNNSSYVPVIIQCIHDASLSGYIWARIYSDVGSYMPLGNKTNYANGYTTQINVSADQNGNPHVERKTYMGANTTPVETRTATGNATSAIPYSGFYINSTDASRVFDIRIYNTTSISGVNFGDAPPSGEPEQTPFTLNIPQGQFSTLNYSASGPGAISFDIFYDPHIILSTPDGSEFGENVTLYFGSNPASIQSPYQIAMDELYYSTVRSGVSSGEIIERLSPGEYFWRVQNLGGEWTSSRTFTVYESPPIDGSLNFTILDELTNGAVTATVSISNDTTTLQKTGSTINFDSAEVTAGNYSVRVNSTNFSTRYYEVTSPGNYTLYVLPTNNQNTSVVYFSLIDNTNQFSYDTTKLEIIKQTPNGAIVIQNSYFDASGLAVATLNQFDNYILKAVSDDGDERIIGNYIHAGQTSVQIVISEIILKETGSHLGGFNYKLEKSNDFIKMEWTDPNNSLTEQFSFEIYKGDDQVMNVSSAAPFGMITYTDSAGSGDGLDQNATYKIIFKAKTTDGNINIVEQFKPGGESVGIDLKKIPTGVRVAISLILLVLVASLFNVTNSRFSAIVISLIASFLVLIGFLPTVPGVLVWALFIAIAAFKTEGG